MKSFYVPIIIIVFCVADTTYSMDTIVPQKSELSLTQRYLELAYIIEYVRPFSGLPTEIRQTIAQYCIHAPSIIKKDSLRNINGFLFSHFAYGNFLIGRAVESYFSIVNIDNNNMVENILSFHNKISRLDMQNPGTKALLCGIFVSTENGNLLIKQSEGNTHLGFHYIINVFTGLTKICNRTFDNNLICHPKMPYCCSIKIEPSIINNTHAVHIYGNTSITAVHSLPNQLIYTYELELDEVSRYSLLWHPLEVKFLCKCKNFLNEYSALSGTYLRSFKTPDISFDPYHIAYVDGGNSCVAVHKNRLYALHVGEEPQEKSLTLFGTCGTVSSALGVQKILGANKKQNQVLLDMFDANGRCFIGMYDIHDDCLFPVAYIPTTSVSDIYNILFDSVTETIAIVQQKNDHPDTRIPQECIRIKCSDIQCFNNDSSLRHLLCGYARVAAQTNYDKELFKTARYRTLAMQTEGHKRW